MAETTTMTVSHLVWRELNKRKNAGESFDDVLRRELSIAHEPPTGHTE